MPPIFPANRRPFCFLLPVTSISEETWLLKTLRHLEDPKAVLWISKAKVKDKYAGTTCVLISSFCYWSHGGFKNHLLCITLRIKKLIVLEKNQRLFCEHLHKRLNTLILMKAKMFSMNRFHESALLRLPRRDEKQKQI